MTAQPFDAGTAAGRRWAARNRARRARIVFWASQSIDAVSRFPIYATCLTDRFMVGKSADPRDQAYNVPVIAAQRLSEAYWGKLAGWPRRSAQRQARFVEGFVRGAAAKAVRP